VTAYVGFGLKATPLTLCGDVRFTPESDRLLRRREVTLCAISDQSAAQQKEVLFDHLSGSEEPRRNGESKRFCSLQIDRKLKLGKSACFSPLRTLAP